MYDDLQVCLVLIVLPEIVEEMFADQCPPLRWLPVVERKRELGVIPFIWWFVLPVATARQLPKGAVVRHRVSIRILIHHKAGSNIVHERLHSLALFPGNLPLELAALL